MNPVRQALAVAVAVRVPVLVWGGPGLGKTSAIRELAEASSMPYEIVIASIREPSDFAGLPIVGAGGTSVHLAPPRWAQRLAEAGSGLLFLDELSTAPPAVQAALLRVVLERTVGDLALPDLVAVVAAANAPEDAADGWDLAPPLANRFCHLDWTLTASEWADGMLGGFAVAPVPDVDQRRLDAAEMGVRGTIAAFVRSRPHLLHAPPKDEASAGRAWPSPRSWATGARLVAAAEVAACGESVVALLLAGSVGAAAAAELLAWRSDLDLPDPESALADPTSFVVPERGDRAYAALASITSAVVSVPGGDRWRAAWEVMAAAASQGQADIAVAAVRTLLRHRPEGVAPPPESVAALAPVLREAGLFDRLQP